MVQGALAAMPRLPKLVIRSVGQGRVETMQDRSHDADEGLGHEEGDVAAERSEQVAAVAMGHPVDEALEAKAAKVVGHARRRVVAAAWVEGSGDDADEDDALLTAEVGEPSPRDVLLALATFEANDGYAVLLGARSATNASVIFFSRPSATIGWPRCRCRKRQS